MSNSSAQYHPSVPHRSPSLVAAPDGDVMLRFRSEPVRDVTAPCLVEWGTIIVLKLDYQT